MSHESTRKLIEQKNAEDLRMAKLELSYTPLVWVVVAAIIVILLVIRK
jgi:hypothetical protein